ncbi:uncharacterized protein [Branchiostoma lanceolatum]|uniref:uncharacterized protein n=1 Tax=Branchiostoma lanceolatum TaxID=7740 RepID=UPI003455D589
MAVRRLTYFFLLVSVYVDSLANKVEMSDYCGSSLNITGPGELGWTKYTSITDCMVALVPHRKDVYITLHFDQVDIAGNFFCYDKIYICSHRPCTSHTANLIICSGRTGGFKGATGGTVYIRLPTANQAVSGSFTLHYYLIKDPAFAYRSKKSSISEDILEAAIGVGLLLVFVVGYLLVRWQARMIREGVNDVVEDAHIAPHSSPTQDEELGLEETGPISASDIHVSDVTLTEIPPPPTYEEVMGTPPSHTTDVDEDCPTHAPNRELDASSGQQNIDKGSVI